MADRKAHISMAEGKQAFVDAAHEIRRVDFPPYERGLGQIEDLRHAGEYSSGADLGVSSASVELVSYDSVELVGIVEPGSEFSPSLA